ncbi:Short-chain dehydrogenase/reductase phmF [Fulvia fulva]|uniref:Short-chain dehydrogenase/reductase phmF n=1 Tax=Passalora fulva TaxID=5499 RepID=A0A9Q8PJA6_PASFU|nr:Short-chain dehydrogenase/reductase phmF [Fulvia fulva]KAK4612163.1 Short-chain dehydrogenase/reductase phmF [Fulvia fulva]KAK4612717.1 Short-chain dehydrogenase/reductase phmF [Fulvia fulva]UJO23467.1 Short-chain dehydrogenase/reductase phmF [Fulvia fulva]WPV21459.1 Short-chain dehydrogenase/reductase phmF [Fulvia fulva]WPV36245.1 Short-chain dehydrogenase/reductase phmF [Fulvia fulva]
MRLLTTLLALIAIIYYLLPLLLAEVFPWQYLWAQRKGRPTVLQTTYSGRTILITGANGAYGSRAAKLFALRDAERLILVDVRDCSHLKEEIEREVEALGNGKRCPQILVWTVDMMTFAGCQELAEKVKGLESGLDHVLMTMGILSFARKESPEGWETSLQVNYLSNACAALLMLPHIRSSPSNPNPPVLTFITSFGIFPASPTMSLPKTGSYLKHLSNNKDGMAQKHQYGRSKGLLLYFARELATRLSAGSGLPRVTVTSADPGTAWTGLTQPNKAEFITRVITDFGARPPEFGAAALVNGVSADASKHGKILHDFSTVPYPPFMERQSGRLAQERVWKETREELEAKVPEIKAVYDQLD